MEVTNGHFRLSATVVRTGLNLHKSPRNDAQTAEIIKNISYISKLVHVHVLTRACRKSKKRGGTLRKHHNTVI